MDRCHSTTIAGDGGVFKEGIKKTGDGETLSDMEY